MSITLSSEQYAHILAALGAAIRSNTEDQIALLREQNALYTSAFQILTGAMMGPAPASAPAARSDELNRAFLEPSPPSSPAVPVPLTPPSPINAVEMEPAAAPAPAPAPAKAPAKKKTKSEANNLPEAGRAPNLNKYPLMDAQWAENPLRGHQQIHIDFSHAGFKQTYHAAPRFTGTHVTFLMTEGPRVPCNSLNNAYAAAQELFLNYVNHQIPEPIEAREANGWLRWYVLDATTGKRISLQKLQQSVPRV